MVGIHEVFQQAAGARGARRYFQFGIGLGGIGWRQVLVGIARLFGCVRYDLTRQTAEVGNIAILTKFYTRRAAEDSTRLYGEAAQRRIGLCEDCYIYG